MGLAKAGWAGGLSRDPSTLAGGAAGFACAALVMWTYRALPLGSIVFWLAPLPLFLAGLALGPLSAWLGLTVASGALLLTAGYRGALVFLLATGLPAVLLVTLALRREHFALALPFMMLGLWPALVAAVSLLFAPTGIGEIMATQVTATLSSSGMDADPATVAVLVRAGLALAASALALPLLTCGVGAQRLLSSRGLALCPTPAWRETRLPGWYPVLPLTTLVIASFSSGLITTATTAALTAPLFLQGLAVLHGRLRGPFLVLLYVVLIVFFIPAAVIAIAVGLFACFGHKPVRS